MLPQKREIKAAATKKGAKAILSFLLFRWVKRRKMATIAPKRKERKKQTSAGLHPRKAPIPAASFTSPIPILSTFNKKVPRNLIVRNIPPPMANPTRLEKKDPVRKLRSSPEMRTP